MIMARWEGDDGKPKRWRGSAAEIAANVPANAPKLEMEQMQRRIEAFVTVGSPTEVKHSKGEGLELVPLQHPNDLYASETSRFRLLLDGKPAKDVDVELVAGGTRYRDAPEQQRFKTDGNGEFAVTWPAPGLFWLDASIADENAAAPNGEEASCFVNARLKSCRSSLTCAAAGWPRRCCPVAHSCRATCPPRPCCPAKPWAVPGPSRSRAICRSRSRTCKPASRPVSMR